MRVSGMDGARAYQMAPNEVVALFDEGDELQHAQTLQNLATQMITTRKKEQPLHDDVCRLTDWIKACQQERMRDVKKMHEAYQASK